jgi:predicted lipase
MSQEENKEFNKDKLIEYDLVLDMLSLSSLVYNFNIDIKTESTKNNKYDLKNLNIENLKVDSKRKELLKQILEKSPNCELYKFYDLQSGSQVGVTISHKQKRISFIFRGSNQLIDWIHDFMICKKEISENIYVHLGFYKSLFEENLFNNLQEDLKKLLEELPDYELYITGHSLGAGLTALFGYLIADIIDKNITLITFASPRVGNKEWANDFNKKKNLRHFRFVNEKDIVTSIPYLYYYHVGNCILINKNNLMDYTKYHEHNDKSYIFYYFNPLDHLIDNYYNNLVICKWNDNNIYCENYNSSTKAEIVSEENIELAEKKTPQNELI